MAPIFKPRRTRGTAVLQFQRERHISFPSTIFTRSRAERIFRQAVARSASTVSRNDGNDVRDSRAGDVKFGISRMGERHIALGYRRANCVCAADDLFFGHIVPKCAKSSLTRMLFHCEK
jgi:transposase InsO family protein